jgi:O-methyltransferase involved in polyketide biosynthesis
LPATNSENELHRIPIDFSTDSLEDKLLSFSKYSSVVIVIEGVFIYLEEEEVRHLLQNLRRIYPTHKLICDLTSREFFEEYSQTMHEKITGLGASFKFTDDDPEKIFLKNGYSRTERISIVKRAVEYGLIKIPRIILRTVLRTLSEGYAIYVFE